MEGIAVAGVEKAGSQEYEALTRRLEVTQAADQDLEEIAVFIGRDNPAAASRFIASAHAAFRHVLEMPNLGSRILADDKRLEGLRRGRIARFSNYLIFYGVTEEVVEIVRVLHGARDIERALRADE